MLKGGVIGRFRFNIVPFQSRSIVTAATLGKRPIYDEKNRKYILSEVSFCYPDGNYGSSASELEIEEILRASTPDFTIPLIGTRPTPNKVMHVVNKAFTSKKLLIGSGGAISPWTTAYPPKISSLWPNAYLTNARNQQFTSSPNVNEGEVKSNLARSAAIWEISHSAGVSWEAMEQIYADYIEEGHRRMSLFDKNSALLLQIFVKAAREHVRKARTRYYQRHSLLDEISLRPQTEQDGLLMPEVQVMSKARVMHRSARLLYITRFFGPGNLIALLNAHVTARCVVREVHDRVYSENDSLANAGVDRREAATADLQEVLDAILSSEETAKVEFDAIVDKEALIDRGRWDFRACLRSGARKSKRETATRNESEAGDTTERRNREKRWRKGENSYYRQ